MLPKNPVKVTPRGEGDTPGNSWRRCAAHFPKSWPDFRPKNVIFRTRFQTRPLKSILVFRPKWRKNPTQWGGTYLYSLCKGVPPPPKVTYLFSPIYSNLSDNPCYIKCNMRYLKINIVVCIELNAHKDRLPLNDTKLTLCIYISKSKCINITFRVYLLCKFTAVPE